MSIAPSKSSLSSEELVATLAELMTQGGFPTTSRELSENLDSLYDKWELDSLGHLDLVVALGNRFGVTITDADAEELKTPAATVHFLTTVLRVGG
ncbi:acyl carrier protein [Kutzneria buriramensis]|uniref:Phosphopantetheine binding protein n=1 Tax=Kutzneria buriramensis TaxID=1045776 RepID=A0A3E0H4C5_9PSEU|nr:acyl carrier protein [Kutzneria buriramensis]REH38085.1 phosphopantetheine binding protein [Kutzneria buriramensis]